MRKKLSVKFLEKRKVPKVLIAGLLLASVLGWTGWDKLEDIKNYYEIRSIFPTQTEATDVLDGDTFVIKNGMTVRLLGIDSPGRGKQNFENAKSYLAHLIIDKKLKFEYDTYQDDKFGRILAYVWITCAQEIKIYCRGDKALVNEIMLKRGLATKITYEKRKKLKYDELLK